jgi:hypothetical protein
VVAGVGCSEENDSRFLCAKTNHVMDIAVSSFCRRRKRHDRLAPHSQHHHHSSRRAPQTSSRTSIASRQAPLRPIGVVTSLQRADVHLQIAHHERPLPPPLCEGRFPRAHCCPPISYGAPRPGCEPEQEDRGWPTANGEIKAECRAQGTHGLLTKLHRPCSSRPCLSSFPSSSSTRPL